MRTNTQFAIAIHVLSLISLEHGEPVTSSVMASSVNTNPAFLRRILGELQRAGLVESQPGVSGGWRLKRAPEAITLLSIFRAVDERHLLGMHEHPNVHCDVGGVIQSTLQEYFGAAEAAFEQALACQTLAQVVRTAQGRIAREAS